ncbi:MAG TPA: hypothetical protein VHV30_13540 [Polyangiaceae bacterium]|jgi:hypothetical protein|nr:hypothetical protein [Polyangiaceae bacterium]
MRWSVAAVGVWAALLVACGSAFTLGDAPDASRDGAVEDARGVDTGLGSEAGPGDATADDAASDAADDVVTIHDAAGDDAVTDDAGQDAAERDAATTDSGAKKDAGVDAGPCPGAGQCGGGRLCPSGERCCPSISINAVCGFCSAGVCPG